MKIDYICMYTYALSQHCFIISYTLVGHLGGLSRRLPLSINSIIWHPFIPCTYQSIQIHVIADLLTTQN